MTIKIGSMQFNKIDHIDILTGKKIVAFVEESKSLTPFTMEVSREGLRFKGDMHGAIVSEKDLQDFARILGEQVWMAKRRLDPKFSETIAGH